MIRLRSLISVALFAVGVCATGAHAQTGAVRGKVTVDGTGEPLNGVTVNIGARVTQTRVDGSFAFDGLPAGTDSIRFRLIGYEPQARSITVTAGQTETLEIRLKAQAVSLATVVVTGYGEQRAGNITGAVTSISTGGFNTGRIVTTEELIQSKVAGVQVIDNNEPGGGISVRIRGATSINASSEPLYVIDGVPIGTGAGAGHSAGRNALNFLNPDDIENITVLRDASAAAIYGANAANGVVIIQTKSGRGKPAVEYTGSMSSSSVTKLPGILNAAQFRSAVTTYAPQNVSQLGNANTNWFDEVGQSAFGQDHNLSVAGSTEAMNWRISGGYLNQAGVIRGTNTERFSLGLNLQNTLLDNRLTVRLSQRGSRAVDDFTPGGVLSNAAQFGPTQPVTSTTTKTGYYEWPGNTLTSADNPVAILKLATDRGVTLRNIGSVGADYFLPFIEGLKGTVNLNYDLTRTDRTTFTPSVLHSQTKTGQNGADYRANQSQTNTGIDAYLNYVTSPRLVPGSIDLTAGYSWGQSIGEYPWFLASGLSTDLLGGNGVTSARTVQNVQNVQESRLISFFGRANYNYEDRYLLGASIRRDGSSRFGPDNAWGYFPSVSGGWRISQEEFMRGFRKVSDLKLRAAWARTGNQAFANYQQYATYQLGDAQTQAQFGNDFISTIRPGAYDPNIRWEETEATDIGLDWGIMNQRITGTIDWYQKKTSDLIFTVPVAAGTNLSNFVTTNIGNMKNSGLEFSVSAGVLRGGGQNLSWTADFTAARNTNELVGINPVFGRNANLGQVLTGLVSGGVGTFIQVLRPGEPINSFYVYEHRRAGGKPIFKEGAGADTAMYVDQNGDKVINQDDRIPFHNPAPDWILGHSSYLSMRNWSLSFTLRSYLGNYVYNNVASNLGTYAEVTRASPYNLHSSVLETGFKTPQYLSDYYVEDASFLRMDNITLSYLLTWRGQPMRVFGTMQNAFTLTDYSGVDPTAGLNGLDNNIYPRSRTISTGVSLKF